MRAKSVFSSLLGLLIGHTVYNSRSNGCVSAFLSVSTARVIRYTTMSLNSSSDSSSSPTFENLGLQRKDPEGSVLGLTENQALTYKKTGSKCLDLFTDVMRDTRRERLSVYLNAAWEEDALTTLKIIFQLGDPRKGKSDRINLHQSLLWLYNNHFETLMLNIENIGKFSYHKSLLEVMVLVAHGSDALDDKRKRQGKYFVRPGSPKETHRRNVELFYQNMPAFLAEGDVDTRADMDEYDGINRWSSKDLREKFVIFIDEQNQEISKKAKMSKKDKERAMLHKAEDMYRSDEKFRRLYDKVADYFAEGLKEDRQRMENGEKYFGLFAKWAPSPRLSHDRHTNICEGIIQRLYPDCYKYRDVDLRTRFFREYLSSIRRAAEIPESFTGPGDWNLVNYYRMPSRCRTIYGEMYRRHDQERYDAYINLAKEKAESGERVTMVAAGALLPHEITQKVSKSGGDLNDELGLQWLRMIQDVKDNGKLPKALAICDVSSSMGFLGSPSTRTQPIEVSVALSLLVSDITDGLFSNQVITFSSCPELVQLPKATVDNLSCRVSFMAGMNWGYNTDFQAVFDVIFEKARKENLDADEMPSILFCFSDMEFDQAHEGNWKTDLELVRAKYAKAGYEVPTIVFWNLRGSDSKPASSEEPGVVMLSGFSAGILKAFLEFQLDNIPTPLTQMIKMLEYYNDLVLAKEDIVDETNSLS